MKDKEGLRSQILRGLASYRRTEVRPEGYTRAGVLVPIVSTAKGYEFLFTKRTEQVETHKGQVSFPGGIVDVTDATIVQTALREALEEVGIPSRSVQIAGLLDDMTTPTGFVITPVVGIIDTVPRLSPNAIEVAEVFSVPIQFFLGPENARTEIREVGGKEHELWFYKYGDHTIWGATAFIVRSLLKTVRLM